MLFYSPKTPYDYYNKCSGKGVCRQAGMGYNEGDMMWFLAVLCLLVLVLLVGVASIVPTRSLLSTAELERRHSRGNKAAQLQLRQNELWPVITSLQRALVAFLLVVLIALLIPTLGWLAGLIVGFIIALEYNSLSQFQLVRKYTQPLYGQYETKILDFAEKYRRGAFRLITNSTLDVHTVKRLDSREELEQLVEESSDLSVDEKKLISHGLSFGERLVSEVMTPRGVIDSISKKELLGPLVLDDLHKTGHSRFPVTDGDIDHVVGMLYIQDLLILDGRQRSSTAEKAMEPRVFYIKEDQTLQHALAAFLRTRHHLFVAVNEFRETVGLLSLEDVIEALLGRKIIDEFDTHEDLRAVAERNSTHNNEPKNHEDV
jgi:CBS domain containing-hemolysin-like protein